MAAPGRDQGGVGLKDSPAPFRKREHGDEYDHGIQCDTDQAGVNDRRLVAAGISGGRIVPGGARNLARGQAPLARTFIALFPPKKNRRNLPTADLKKSGALCKKWFPACCKNRMLLPASGNFEKIFWPLGGV